MLCMTQTYGPTPTILQPIYSPLRKGTLENIGSSTASSSKLMEENSYAELFLKPERLIL